MKIKIAVCIPAFSSAENIKNCLDSIIKSNDNVFDLNILLYNNSTKQDIIDICKEYAIKFNNIQLFDIRSNRGCSLTWNDAIEYVYHTKPNYFSSLIIVNDDIQFLDDSFILFVNKALANPDIPVITCVDISADGYSIFSYSRFAYEKVGFFDENIRPAYFEDADFVSRIEKQNLKMMEFKINILHVGSSSIPENDLRNEFDNIHLPRTKDYYHKKWDNQISHKGFPTNFIWPFNRREEKFRISYWQRKTPHPFFTNIKEVSFAFDKFEEIKNTTSDINQHLESIYQHIKGCNIAVSLGVSRGYSAFALLMGCQHHITVDPAPNQDALNLLSEYFGQKSEVVIQNTNEQLYLDEFDILFVDYVHTGECVEKEIKAHAHKVKKFIFFHDTNSFGDVGEDGKEGIKKPILDFLLENEEWRILYCENKNNGMIILGK
jgi:GT2 family glycosyltransferase